MRVRPTADRVKEAIFNILHVLIPDLKGCRVLDIFAGTGNLGIEALSRGAASATFLENSRQSTALIIRNLESTGFEASGRLIQKDALAALKNLAQEGKTFHLIFLDPPYEKGLLEKALETLGQSPLLDQDTIVVAEFSARESISDSFGQLLQFDRRSYGDTVVSFLALESPPSTKDDDERQ